MDFEHSRCIGVHHAFSNFICMLQLPYARPCFVIWQLNPQARVPFSRNMSKCCIVLCLQVRTCLYTQTMATIILCTAYKTSDFLFNWWYLRNLFRDWQVSFSLHYNIRVAILRRWLVIASNFGNLCIASQRKWFSHSLDFIKKELYQTAKKNSQHLIDSTYIHKDLTALRFQALERCKLCNKASPIKWKQNIIGWKQNFWFYSEQLVEMAWEFVWTSSTTLPSAYSCQFFSFATFCHQRRLRYF